MVLAQLYRAWALAMLSAVGTAGEGEMSISDVPLDDACVAGDAGCVLSLRQLRGELSTRDLKVAAGSSVNITAETASKIASKGGACIGQTGWDVDFAERAYRCGLKTMANAYYAGRCMASGQHVSQDCGRCMGDLIHCGLKCVRPCCYGRCYDRADCVACGVEHCHQPFIACAGMAPPGGR